MCQHAGLQYTDPRYGQLRTAVNDDGKTTDGYIRGLGNRSLFIDVTIANPTGPTYMSEGSTIHRHYALNDLAAGKVRKYANRCDAFGSDFTPLAFEIYGATSPEVDNFIKAVVSKAAEVNNINYAILLNYWKKRLSVNLQIGNVAIISEGYRRLYNYGGGSNMDRDSATERLHE